MQVMKIAVISRGWWPSIRGGSEKFTVKVSSGLHSRGHEVVGITRWVLGSPKPEAQHKLIIMRESKVYPLISSLRFSLWAARVANELAVDVILVNSYWGEISPLYINRPCAVVIHDLGFLNYGIGSCAHAQRTNIRFLGKMLRKYVISKVLKRANAILVPSNTVLSDMLRTFDVNLSKVHVLGFEGVDGPFKKIHIENEWFDIVHIGRFASNKGQLVLLKAFYKLARRLPNARLWLVGAQSIGHTRYLNTVISLTKRINMKLGERRVYVIVDAPSVDWYYKIADVCVFPSLSEEGYGLAVLEAMAYGKPVICTDIFVATGVASSERALIIPRNDINALVNAIIKLHDDDKLREMLSQKGLDYAKLCRWDKVVDRVEKILLSIIS